MHVITLPKSTLKSLISEVVATLEALPIDEEIGDIIWSFYGLKAPRYDRYNFTP